MIETITFQNEKYPKFQSTGFASQFAFPFALQVCKGVGFDIGCMKKEWALPGAIPIDESFDDPYNAMNLPDMNFPFNEVDFIFASHSLEHMQQWVEVLDYWKKKLKSGGVLFLYLPHYDQHYWRPWNNRKHINIFTPQIVKDYLTENGFINVFVGERDLYHSFMAMAEKE